MDQILGSRSAHFRFPFLERLIACKTTEGASPVDLDWPHHQATLADLERQLDQSFEQSKLPDKPDRRAINDFLIHLRLGGGEHAA
jgi:hypothetical protein